MSFKAMLLDVLNAATDVTLDMHDVEQWDDSDPTHIEFLAETLDTPRVYFANKEVTVEDNGTIQLTDIKHEHYMIGVKITTTRPLVATDLNRFTPR